MEANERNRDSPEIREDLFFFHINGRRTKQLSEQLKVNEKQTGISSTLLATFSNRTNFEIIILIREYTRILLEKTG